MRCLDNLSLQKKTKIGFPLTPYTKDKLQMDQKSNYKNYKSVCEENVRGWSGFLNQNTETRTHRESTVARSESITIQIL